MRKFYKQIYKLKATVLIFADNENEALSMAERIVADPNCPFTIDNTTADSVQEVKDMFDVPEGWAYYAPVVSYEAGEIDYHDMDTTGILKMLSEPSRSEEDSDLVTEVVNEVKKLREELEALKKELKKKK